MTVDSLSMDNSTQPSKSSTRFTRRRFLTGTALAVAAAGLYPTELERHFIDVVHQTFAIRGLPEAFRGFRVVQLSDIHLEWFTEDVFLRLAVARINALKPDMVLLTGDFITNNEHGPDTRAYAALPHCGEILSRLHCPLIYSVLGNHDVEVDAPAVTAMLSSHGLNPLVNRFVAIERAGQQIWLAGLDNASYGNPDLNLAVPEKPERPVLLMCHEPDYADTVVAHPRGQFVDVMLSGHSHGGQVQIPFVGPLELPPLGKKYYEGRYQFDRTLLYVNRGLGTVGLPVRFNCPPEITRITLEPA
jgi:predicted MPP superfamily phosphohydrolase